MKYCSVHCQRTHFRDAHKAQCKQLGDEFKERERRDQKEAVAFRDETEAKALEAASKSAMEGNGRVTDGEEGDGRATEGEGIQRRSPLSLQEYEAIAIASTASPLPIGTSDPAPGRMLLPHAPTPSPQGGDDASSSLEVPEAPPVHLNELD